MDILPQDICGKKGMCIINRVRPVLVLICLVFLSARAEAGSKIKYYFNRAVDTSVSSGVNAIYLNNCIADTLTAYLNRAKYSLDICMYDFEKTYSYNINIADTVFAPEVAAAINNAHARGVKVRYIYEASNANTGISLLDTPAIPVLGSPQGPNYTIMHNKFVVIDAASPNPADPIVWTGCLNWYYEQFNWDYNNVVIFQDSALAYAYTAEFNMMWGDTGTAPNLTNSKFGQYKTDLGLHDFTIEGNHIELYFSPSDGTDAHIQSTIESANTDLYFGEYTFTEHNDANDIVNKFDSGVYVSGIDDSWSNGEYPTDQFNAHLGAHFKVYTESADTLYHNKFLIVDPSDTCSDPAVLTGSHNWSVSANEENDENTVIIHNDTAANLFLQYFKATFNMLGGSLTPPLGNCSPANDGVQVQLNATPKLTIFPNPSTGRVSITYRLIHAENVTIDIFNVLGQQLASPVNNAQQPSGNHECSYTFNAPGLYVVKMSTGSSNLTQKVLIAGE